MKRITAIFSMLIVLFAAALPAGAAELNTFKNLTAYTSSGAFSLVFEFEGKPVERLRFSEKYLQIDFSSSRMSTPKKIYDISRSGIATVEISQSSQDTVRVLINPSVDVKTLGRSLSLEKRSGKLILRFSMPKSLAASATPVAKVAPKQAAVEQKANQKRNRISSLDTKFGKKDKTGGSASKLEKVEANRAATELKAALSKTSLSVSPVAMVAPVAPAAPDKKGGKKLFADFSEPEIPAVPSLGESLVKVGGALAVVLAMVLILAFAAKRYLSGAEGALGSKKQLKVLSSHFIGVKKSVTIVEIAGEILALGVTNENINLLAKYDDPEKIERIKMTHRLPDKPTGIFKSLPLLSRISGSKGGKKRGFSKEMESRARTMKEREQKLSAKRKTDRAELVSRAAGTISAHIRKMENAAG